MELAAEAKEAGAASVTLVHSRPHLGSSEGQGKKLANRLSKVGVSVVLGKRCQPTENTGKAFKWDENGELKFDEVLWCTGCKPVSAFARPLGNVFTPSGHFDVNAHFQVCHLAFDKDTGLKFATEDGHTR
jgi:NADPH-dependent 2,4-dienoyl-CoA reductase/sulfur reductase-like enzyme